MRSTSRLSRLGSEPNSWQHHAQENLSTLTCPACKQTSCETPSIAGCYLQLLLLAVNDLSSAAASSLWQCFLKMCLFKKSQPGNDLWHAIRLIGRSGSHCDGWTNGLLGLQLWSGQDSAERRNSRSLTELYWVYLRNVFNLRKGFIVRQHMLVLEEKARLQHSQRLGFWLQCVACCIYYQLVTKILC